MKSPSARSWIWYVQELLRDYNLPSAFVLLKSLPMKEAWKQTVKSAFTKKWEKDLEQEARTKKTTDYLNMQACNLRRVHPVWQLGATDTITVLKASLKAKLLIQRYPLFYSGTAGTNYGQPCPLCSHEKEFMAHFLFKCPLLADIRIKYECKLIRHELSSAINTR